MMGIIGNDIPNKPLISQIESGRKSAAAERQQQSKKKNSLAAQLLCFCEARLRGLSA
jgi:hypothetical protein